MSRSAASASSNSPPAAMPSLSWTMRTMGNSANPTNSDEPVGSNSNIVANVPPFAQVTLNPTRNVSNSSRLDSAARLFLIDPMQYSSSSSSSSSSAAAAAAADPSVAPNSEYSWSVLPDEDEL